MASIIRQAPHLPEGSDAAQRHDVVAEQAQRKSGFKLKAPLYITFSQSKFESMVPLYITFSQSKFESMVLSSQGQLAQPYHDVRDDVAVHRRAVRTGTDELFFVVGVCGKAFLTQ